MGENRFTVMLVYIETIAGVERLPVNHCRLDGSIEKVFDLRVVGSKWRRHGVPRTKLRNSLLQDCWLGNPRDDNAGLVSVIASIKCRICPLRSSDRRQQRRNRKE